ncbi:MAG: hypothetical protein QM703_25440 [Gemmatales bacterium]
MKKTNSIKLTPLQLAAIKTCNGILDQMPNVRYSCGTLLDVAIKLAPLDAGLFKDQIEGLSEILKDLGDHSDDVDRCHAVAGILKSLLLPPAQLTLSA